MLFWLFSVFFVLILVVIVLRFVSKYVEFRETGIINQFKLRQGLNHYGLTKLWDNLIYKDFHLSGIEQIFPYSESQARNGRSGDRAQCFAVHTTELFTLSGSKNGRLSIFRFQELPYTNLCYYCHSSRISDIRQVCQRPIHIFTCGFDGKVKVTDVSRIGREIQNINNNNNNHNNNNNTADNLIGETVIDNRGSPFHSLDIRNSGFEIIAADNLGIVHHLVE